MAQTIKNLPAVWETWVRSLGWEDTLEEGVALQYSFLENPHGQGALWATVHGVTKSQTRLSNFAFPFTFITLGKSLYYCFVVLGKSFIHLP